MDTREFLNLLFLLSNTDSQLIKELHLRHKMDLPDVDWEQPASEVADQLVKFCETAPVAHYQYLTTVAKRIKLMNYKGGIDTLRKSMVLTPEFHAFDKQPVNQLLWCFIFHNEHFVEAEDIRYSLNLCDSGQGTLFQTHRVIPLPQSPDCKPFQEELARLLQTQKEDIQVRAFTRKEFTNGEPVTRHHFVIYREGEGTLLTELQNQGLELVGSTIYPVRESVILYTPEQQQYEVLAKEKSEQKLLSSAFAETILGIPADNHPRLIPREPLPLHLLRTRPTFDWDATDDIQSVFIKKFILANTHTTGNASFEGISQEHDAYAEMLNLTGSEAVPLHYRIREMTFEVIYTSGHPGSVVFDVMADGTISLHPTHERFIRILNELLPRWLHDSQPEDVSFESLLSEIFVSTGEQPA
ncbi:hypothetical protein [Sansalvadorimonas verongulae]|uniref:hypothetical protein n=1 Tax=Sansalvadorimonas verongulae TaxID=2172824 RepID=UPI0012BBCCD8|nr:hypothetical protein [Sansalvadorimonas verongulae]MTI15122.1 hypothetical protein [Sansalvadorimonas verongulae]